MAMRMVDMTTFDRLKKLCEEQKISVVELEEKLGFGRNSLYGWKKKIPNGANLEKVADYFNVSVDYLLGRTDDKILSNVEFDEKTRSIARDFQDLDDESQDLFQSLIKTMSSRGKEAKK